MRLVEWNINKRSKGLRSKPFVIERLLMQKADVICLVEYTHDADIIRYLENNYWYEESIVSSGNQVLIAVSKETAPEGIKMVRNWEEKDCYNILHLRYKDISGKDLSVIGIRMLTGAGEKAINAQRQTAPLNKYLAQINEPFICAGDFNILDFRMKHWFPQYHTGAIESGEDVLSCASFVFTKRYRKTIINNTGAIDHILLPLGYQARTRYSWDFIGDDDIYPTKERLNEGALWDIKPGFPDHAIMICEIDI